jgi:hypothetical protein|nr:hypothetical protein 495p1_00143 [Serratia proteamaculans]
MIVDHLIPSLCVLMITSDLSSLTYVTLMLYLSPYAV